MEMQLGYKDGGGPSGPKFWPIYLCFITFGILIPFTKAELSIITLLVSILVALVVGFMAVNMLIIAFNSGNAALTAVNGQFAREAVASGMLFMIPFTVLAILAQVVLGWDAVMPFASAAVMTAATSAGSEVMKMGAQGIKNVMIPSGLAFLLSTGWMLLIGILP